MFHKSEKEKYFAYLAHTACDDANFILGFEVTSGNIHDSVAFQEGYINVYKRYKDLGAMSIDLEYRIMIELMKFMLIKT